MRPVKNLLVISVIGPDQPGLVQQLSKAIADSGCNLEESRMAKLGSEFGMILLASGKWNELAKLESALPVVARRLNLLIHCKRTEPARIAAELLPYAVEVTALDQPGIVQQLAEFFAYREINIRELSATSYQAARTGTPMCSVHMVIDAPASTFIAHLRDDFMDFCDELNLDAIMEPIKS